MGAEAAITPSLEQDGSTEVSEPPATGPPPMGEENDSTIDDTTTKEEEEAVAAGTAVPTAAAAAIEPSRAQNGSTEVSDENLATSTPQLGDGDCDVDGTSKKEEEKEANT